MEPKVYKMDCNELTRINRQAKYIKQFIKFLSITMSHDTYSELMIKRKVDPELLSRELLFDDALRTDVIFAVEDTEAIQALNRPKIVPPTNGGFYPNGVVQTFDPNMASSSNRATKKKYVYKKKKKR